MPYSYHSHSGQFCHHGYGELEHVVQQAIEKNFKVYGLTEHMPRFDQKELYPEELDVSNTRTKATSGQTPHYRAGSEKEMKLSRSHPLFSLFHRPNALPTL